MRVIVCDPIHPDGLSILRSAGFQVDDQAGIERGRLMALIPEYDVAIIRGRTKFDAPLINAATRLRIIGRAGVGLDNVDAETARARGIQVSNTPRAPSTSVAELTIGLILSLLRKIPLADREMKAGRWIKNQLMGEELQGKKVGVIGRAGRIGNEVSRILTVGFQADVLGYDVIKPRGIPGLSYDFTDSLEDLLQRSEIVTIHVPYTPQTHHLLDGKRLAMMSHGSYLINTSRGDIVDGRSLLDLLRKGQLAGAGLDVFHLEPPVDEWEKAMVSLPNGVTVTTCHIGAQTLQAQRRESIELAQKIVTEASKIVPQASRA
ncbi:MAG TPA: hydroxyacid dehydrogenase [Candidatus Bathyarchaeia archaeon]|nr:hydroxyacid dehydrogenase [Candidatus Bathyarchaeia archaeon]